VADLGHFDRHGTAVRAGQFAPRARQASVPQASTASTNAAFTNTSWPISSRAIPSPDDNRTVPRRRWTRKKARSRGSGVANRGRRLRLSSGEGDARLEIASSCGEKRRGAGGEALRDRRLPGPRGRTGRPGRRCRGGQSGQDPPRLRWTSVHRREDARRPARPSDCRLAVEAEKPCCGSRTGKRSVKQTGSLSRRSADGGWATAPDVSIMFQRLRAVWFMPPAWPDRDHRADLGHQQGALPRHALAVAGRASCARSSTERKPRTERHKDMIDMLCGPAPGHRRQRADTGWLMKNETPC